MNMILCYQTPYDSVTYITDDILSPDYLQYSKFLDFVQPFIKEDFAGFVKNLNRFYTLLIDIKKGTWQLYRKKQKEPTFEELIKLKEKEEKRKKLKRNKTGKTEQGKSYVNYVVNTSHGLNDVRKTNFFGDLKKRDLGNLKILGD